METFYIDPSDPTMPENYLQLKAAIDKDCEKHEQIRATKNQEHRNQEGRTLREKRHEQKRQKSRGQIAIGFGCQES